MKIGSRTDEGCETPARLVLSHLRGCLRRCARTYKNNTALQVFASDGRRALPQDFVSDNSIASGAKRETFATFGDRKPVALKRRDGHNVGFGLVG